MRPSRLLKRHEPHVWSVFEIEMRPSRSVRGYDLHTQCENATLAFNRETQGT